MICTNVQTQAETCKDHLKRAGDYFIEKHVYDRVPMLPGIGQGDIMAIHMPGKLLDTITEMEEHAAVFKEAQACAPRVWRGLRSCRRLAKAAPQKSESSFYKKTREDWLKDVEWLDKDFEDGVNTSTTQIDELAGNILECRNKMKDMLESAGVTRYTSSFQQALSGSEGSEGVSKWLQKNQESFRHCHWLVTWSWAYLQEHVGKLVQLTDRLAGNSRWNVGQAKRLVAGFEALEHEPHLELGDKRECRGFNLKFAKGLQSFFDRVMFGGQEEKPPKVDTTTMECAEEALNWKCTCKEKAYCVAPKDDEEDSDEPDRCFFPI